MNMRKGELFVGAARIGRLTLLIGASVLAALLASNARAAALDSYATLEDAAKAALSDAEALTDKFEAGGTIYQCGSLFAYMGPTTDGKRDRLTVTVYGSDKCKLAALYHTHPKGDGRFSATDVRGVCALDTISFIKPRNGAVRMFDCRGMSYAAKQVAASRAITGETI